MIFNEKFYVGYSDINKELKLSNTSILKLFENIACMHSSAIGDGMKASGGTWFLKAYHVKIHKRPSYEEKVMVSTWSREMKGFSASREFEIYDTDGTLAVTGISNWARINRETLLPERISPDYFEIYQSEPEHTNFGSSWIGKLKECDTYLSEKEFRIERNMIDSNNHMNNVYYLELANLVLPEEVYERPESTEVEILYKKSIQYGETVHCFYGETTESSIITIKSADLSEIHAIIRLLKS